MWAVGVGVPSALPCLPDPTVALYLFGSCFGDWVGLDWSQGCVQSFTLPHLHTPSNTLSLLSAPPAWGQNNLLLHNGSPSGCLPATPYTLTETAIPHPVLNKCVCQGVFARFLRVGSLKGWGVGVCFELKSNRGDRQRTQFL